MGVFIAIVIVLPRLSLQSKPLTQSPHTKLVIYRNLNAPQAEGLRARSSISSSVLNTSCFAWSRQPRR